eukprot:GDKI01039782.1.p2 GENE.GDKI01039782.1~~GDKI01039782.1.p2  ORF type:complete len:190 (-),score=10.48 GDKI01039782.1:13-546(-)
MCNPSARGNTASYTCTVCRLRVRADMSGDMVVEGDTEGEEGAEEGGGVSSRNDLLLVWGGLAKPVGSVGDLGGFPREEFRDIFAGRVLLNLPPFSCCKGLSIPFSIIIHIVLLRRKVKPPFSSSPSDPKLVCAFSSTAGNSGLFTQLRSSREDIAVRFGKCAAAGYGFAARQCDCTA